MSPVALLVFLPVVRLRGVTAKIALSLAAIGALQFGVTYLAYIESFRFLRSYEVALLTITTPHRGTPYADWCLENIGKRMGGLRLMKLLGLDVRAISDLTTAPGPLQIVA